MSGDQSLESNHLKRQTLCFPLSAILVLLSETLAYPASAHAETDVELIHDFVQYLERLKSEGCEVHRLLNGCRRIWSIATCALIASQTDQKVTVFEQTREVSNQAGFLASSAATS